MATLPVYDMKGSKVGSYEIDPAEIAPSINKQLLHDVVVMYQARRRQGSARTRNRAEIAGSTKKLYRQKGTGNARAGTRKSGIRRGGGHIFALRPRNFGYSLPRKAVRAATKMAIAGKIQSEQVLVVDELKFSEPKTKDMAELLNKLELSGSTTLVTTEAHDEMVHKSARNISGVSVSPVSDLNALSILTPKKILITKGALDVIKNAKRNETFAPKTTASAADEN